MTRGFPCYIEMWDPGFSWVTKRKTPTSYSYDFRLNVIILDLKQVKIGFLFCIFNFFILIYIVLYASDLCFGCVSLFLCMYRLMGTYNVYLWLLFLFIFLFFLGFYLLVEKEFSFLDTLTFVNGDGRSSYYISAFYVTCCIILEDNISCLGRLWCTNLLACAECASLTTIPRGDWYCTYCQNMFQREKFLEHNENALAAGRVSGVDPIEEISRRCIRIVRNIEADLSGCVLCR